MQICRVLGHIWAPKKESSLEGMKLMVLSACRDGIVTEEELVAADLVGAGIGEDVIVVSGSTARRAAGSDSLPIDAAIVGIIDTVETEREKKW